MAVGHDQVKADMPRVGSPAVAGLRRSHGLGVVLGLRKLWSLIDQGHRICRQSCCRGADMTCSINRQVHYSLQRFNMYSISPPQHVPGSLERLAEYQAGAPERMV